MSQHSSNHTTSSLLVQSIHTAAISTARENMHEASISTIDEVHLNGCDIVCHEGRWPFEAAFGLDLLRETGLDTAHVNLIYTYTPHCAGSDCVYYLELHSWRVLVANLCL